ncbi:MAG: hypothetical protein C0604_07160, partial [Clostridiales bacterium]
MMNRILGFLEFFEIPQEEAETVCEDFANLLALMDIDERVLDQSIVNWKKIPYDVHLKGVRRFLGLVIREAVALAGLSKLREKGVKIVYASVPLPLP